jgi:hypothetical protein
MCVAWAWTRLQWVGSRKIGVQLPSSLIFSIFLEMVLFFVTMWDWDYVHVVCLGLGLFFEFLFSISRFHHNPHCNLQMFVAFHAFPCPWSSHSMQWISRQTLCKRLVLPNTLSLLNECCCQYSSSQMHKSLQFALFKCFHRQGHLPLAFSNCQYCLPTKILVAIQ